MINILRKTSLWVDKVTGNTTFQFSLIFIAGIIAGFQAGEQTTFYNLSKDPQAAIVELIYKKCRGNNIVVKDIRGPWSPEQITCWREELAHVRDNTFKTEMYFKIGQYTHECNIKKEDQKKCQADISSKYQKMLKTLMDEFP
ncbi:TPA_asm: hypothetical protein G0M21_18565 [Salmonella enterica subsp. enterica serovar Typhimurium]|uniref:Uncharacterized protein n=1 Tax=Salmonella typhimurium TaxID=90371 RepID=A0A708NEW7_SALTM|nr:Uncharacterised protein [Salmonella enterica subsp. enterica serovar Bovismorbificans]HAD0571684.1 hypothetical protein [Salmonella enterica subsp. enterica serovar Typhimurium]